MSHLFLNALLLAAVTLPLTRVSAPTPAPEISTAADKFAAGGYDVTAYFRDGKPARGSARFQLDYKGAKWRFASAKTRSEFKANPAAFAPQFGGYCAWAVSQGYLAPGDPRQWKVVGGKLYLNFNDRAKELWEADQADAIARGHTNWPGVLTDNQDSEPRRAVS